MLATMLLLCCAVPQPAVLPDRLLTRVREHMADNLARLPNYTCGLRVERNARAPQARRFEFLDRLRFEISYVGARELFAWPGAEKFEEKSVFDLVPRGTAATGSFALHARAIFTTGAATFEYKGEGIERGRKLLRWDYRISRENSKYVVRSTTSSGEEVSVVAGYHGSFWADAASLDLVRLEVAVDEISPPLNITRGSENVVYARTRIGASEFLLPATSDLYTVDRAGVERHNHTDYEACRQFAGESVVHFGDSGAASAAAPKTLQELPPPPAGLDVELVLGSSIHVTKSAIGDPVRARLVRAVKKGDQVVLPKDAVVTGRICRIEHSAAAARQTLYLVGVQFDRIEYGKGRAPFRGVLESVSMAGTRQFRAVPPGPDDRPGEGIFSIQGGQVSEVSNLLMNWRTTEVK